MRRAALVLVVVLAVLGGAQPAYARHGGDREAPCDSDRESSCNRSGRNCEGSGECDSFSPHFDKSPVDISHNQFCVMPGSCSGGDGGQKPAPKTTAGMVTDPAKLVEFPLTMAKMTLQFVQQVFTLVV